MMNKSINRYVINISMTVLLLVSMSYALTGQKLHEKVGMVMFILFVFHNLLNIRWYKNIFKGKYTRLRLMQTVINLLIFFDVICLMVSGILMSWYVFGFISFNKGMSLARELHLISSYWGFVLMSVHLGMHFNMITGVIQKSPKPLKKFSVHITAWRIIEALIFLYGSYALWKHDFISYMFLIKRFAFLDPDQSILLFLLDYLCIMGLCVFLVQYIKKLILQLIIKE